MSIKSDKWIRRMAEQHGMIEPFEPGQVREDADGHKIVSYGTSSYGYDIRCAPEFKVFTNIYSTVVDPKNFDEKSFVDINADVCIIPPNSFALARTLEYFRIPRNVLTICLGKSTYARCGIIVNVTPFEPEWEGYVTLEFSNTTPLPAKIYAGEGCAQVLFFESDEVCETSYKDRGGKYQGQRGVTLAEDQHPKLTLYRGRYPTGCGQGQAAMGPFYCPADAHVYLDMGFFHTMRQRLGAPGQFAQAYVIAHEVGHHVQNLLGISDKVDAMRQRGCEAQANAMSVRLELQADCFAGVWAKRSQAEQGWRLEPGDIETALNAASQIGDDTLQRKSRGTVVPESFTHGTSAQRVGWFKRGFESGSDGQLQYLRSAPAVASGPPPGLA